MRSHIGRQMGLPAQELRSLVLAAQMHDVGKIGVPNAILMKPDHLTDDEYARGEAARAARRQHRPARGGVAAARAT